MHHQLGGNVHISLVLLPLSYLIFIFYFLYLFLHFWIFSITPYIQEVHGEILKRTAIFGIIQNNGVQNSTTISKYKWEISVLQYKCERIREIIEKPSSDCQLAELWMSFFLNNKLIKGVCVCSTYTLFIIQFPFHLNSLISQQRKMVKQGAIF